MTNRLSVLLFAFACPALCQTGLAPQNTPLPPMTVTTVPTDTNGSVGIVQTDCNGDGIPDLITLNRTGTLSIFIGNGDTTYQAAQNKTFLTTTFFPISVDGYDINGDGKTDLVVASNTPSAIYPLLGNGSCGFTVQAPIQSVLSPSLIRLADVNGDGKTDLVVSTASAKNLNVLLGNGNGTFGSPITSILGSSPLLFALGDFNGDGKPDVAATDSSASGIWVALGDGAGGFNGPKFYHTGLVPQTPAIGDINGDGRPDLVVATRGDDTVSVFLNQGNGAGGVPMFSSPFIITLPPGTGPGSPLLITSPGGDKQDELVVPGFNANNVNVYPHTNWLIGDSYVSVPPRSTIFPTGFDPDFPIAIPGPGIAAPGFTGLNLLQPNCTVKVSPSASKGTLYFGPNPPALIPGLELEVDVAPGCSWTAAVTFNAKPVSYASVTPSSGVGPATVLVQMQPNTQPDARGARITFTSGKSSDFAFASQAGSGSTCTYPTVDKTRISAGPTGGSPTVNGNLPATSDGCKTSTGATNPAVTVSPTDITGTGNPFPVIFNIPANPGDTTNFYGFIGPNLITITSTGACPPNIGSFPGTVPATGGTILIPLTIPPGCTITPSTSGLGATTTVQQVMAPGAGGALASFNVQVSVPATTSTNPQTGTVTIGGRVAHLIQKAATPTQLFTDVPPTHSYFDWITLMKRLAITSGCSPTTYCPDDTVTRGQMAVFIIRSLELGDTFPYTTTPYFTDVPSTHPYYRYIQRMKDLGITVGCSPTTYCPNDPVTRGQMAVFLIRARLGVVGGIPVPYPGDQFFTDEPPSDPYYAFIQNMKAQGITVGCSTTTYCPTDPITRGQMAVFIIRTFFAPQ